MYIRVKPCVSVYIRMYPYTSGYPRRTSRSHDPSRSSAAVATYIRRYFSLSPLTLSRIFLLVVVVCLVIPRRHLRRHLPQPRLYQLESAATLRIEAAGKLVRAEGEAHRRRQHIPSLTLRLGSRSLGRVPRQLSVLGLGVGIQGLGVRGSGLE